MKQKDIDFIKDYLKNDILLNDFHAVIKTREGLVKIFYNDLIVTICEFGFAYLVGWYAEGSITSSKAENLSKLCRTYNGRF